MIPEVKNCKEINLKGIIGWKIRNLDPVESQVDACSSSYFSIPYYSYYLTNRIFVSSFKEGSVGDVPEVLFSSLDFEDKDSYYPSWDPYIVFLKRTDSNDTGPDMSNLFPRKNNGKRI